MKIEFVGSWKYLTVCGIIGLTLGLYGVPSMVLNYVMSIF